VENLLGQLFRHNLWANLTMLDACRELTDAQLDSAVPGTRGTIRETLKHIAGAEERYVAALRSEPRPEPRESAPWEGIAGLRASLDSTGRALIEIAEAEQPGRILRGVRGNEPYELPAWLLLTQAINHATEHRSQIATILTQQGIRPPEMDGWHFYEQSRG